jgi:hypothetical protein
VKAATRGADLGSAGMQDLVGFSGDMAGVGQRGVG